MTSLTAEAIHQDLQSKFGDMIGDLRREPAATGTPFIIVGREWIRDVCLYLRDDAKYLMNNLNLLSCVDYRSINTEEYKDQLGVVYHMSALHNVDGKWQTVHSIALRTYAPINDPHVPSVARVWRTADWHEREGYDMIGIVFDEHPDMRRILLPDDWIGHPLLKDYVTPEYYNGMKVPY